jgi:hypothetical protein
MHSIDRRAFVQFSTGLFGTVGAAAGWSAAGRAASDAGPAADPHFFLLVNYQGSLDSSYLFDARPLAMTGAGVIQNYLGQAPDVWTGANGVTTLATPLTAPLAPFRDRFSVLNGVQMAVSFDGHEQNTNMLATGNPFGGVAFYADLNRAATPAPLDYLQLGDVFGLSVTNGGAGVVLDAKSAPQLSATVRRAFVAGNERPIRRFARGRMAINGQGAGAFSQGSMRMVAGLDQATGLAGTLASMTFPDQPSDDPMSAALSVVTQYFLRGAASSAFVSFSRLGDLDTHSPAQAAQQPRLYRGVVADLVNLFTTLSSTQLPDGSGRNLLDVTTVLVASEFGRTLRQRGLRMEETGTDHNPLANEMLIGGKGVRGGYVVGATDMQAADDSGAAAPTSGAHRGFDAETLKAMGRPFDFDRLAPADALPEAYDAAHYLGVASVVNTVYKLFGIDPSRYWLLGRNLPAARTLDGLLV